MGTATMKATLERPTRNASTTAVPIAAHLSSDYEDNAPFSELERRRHNLDEWDKCIRALVALRDYKDDWDGEGANATAPENISRAIQYVGLLRRHRSSSAPKVAPGVSGEVLLTWRKGTDSLEVEICRPDRFEWMRMRPDGTAEHWVDGGELTRVLNFLANR